MKYIMEKELKWFHRISLPLAYLQDERIKPVEFKTLAVLQSFNHTGEPLEISLKDFSAKLGVSIGTLSKAINNLMEMGYLTVYECTDPETGARLCNQYQLDYPGVEE